MPSTLAVVLRQRVRHVGLLRTPLGTVGPTERTFEVLGIDVLSIHDERICRIWVVADELSRPAQLEYESGVDLPARQSGPGAGDRGGRLSSHRGQSSDVEGHAGARGENPPPTGLGSETTKAPRDLGRGAGSG